MKMSEKPPITDVDMLAFSEVIKQAPQKCIEQLSSNIQGTRMMAYNRICELLMRRYEGSGEMVERIPELFSCQGDILSALSVVQTRMELGEMIEHNELVDILFNACKKYTQTEKQNEYDKEVLLLDPGAFNPEIVTLSQFFLSQVQEKVAQLMSHVDVSVVDGRRLDAEYAFNIEKNPSRAIEQYRILLDTMEATVQDYLNLGELLGEIGDDKGVCDMYRLGYTNTGDNGLFFHAVNSLCKIYGEREAKTFFNAHKGPNNQLPFSFYRGEIALVEELADLENIIPTFFRTLYSNPQISGYLQRSSDFIQKQIGITFSSINKLKSGKSKKSKKYIEEMETLAIRLLDLLKYQIYFLLDFQNLESYLSIVSEYLKDKSGRIFLNNYFSNHTMSALEEFFHGEIHDEVDQQPVENQRMYKNDTTLEYLECMSVDSGHEDVDGLYQAANPLDIVGLRSHILVRYTYLQFRISFHEPNDVNNVDDTGKYYTSNRQALFLIYEQYKNLFPDHALSEEIVNLDRRVQNEENMLVQLGPDSQKEYKSLMIHIDEKFGVIFRRLIQYHARNEQFTKDTCPHVCGQSSLLMMFFICERLISSNDALFEGNLTHIIANFPIGQLSDYEILLFVEILTQRGYYTEAFDCIIHSEGSLKDPHILRVLADIFATADWSSDVIENNINALDKCSFLEYGRESFIDLLYENLDEEKLNLSECSQEGKLDNERYDACKIGYAHLLYTLGVFTFVDAQEYSIEYLRESVSLGSHDALLFQVEAELKDPECDPDNILDSLLIAFEESMFPTRGHFYGLILKLALKQKKMDVFQKFVQLALVEKVDIIQYNIVVMLQDDHARALLYRYLVVSDQHPNLDRDDLIRVQDSLNQDVRDSYIPLDMKIRASLLKNSICSHPEYGVIPSIVDHINSLCDWASRMGELDFQIELTQVLREIYTDFDVSIPRERVFPNILNHHLLTLKSQILMYMKENKDNKKTLEALIKYLTTFTLFAISILAHVPGVETESIDIRNEDNSLTRFRILDYWIQENEKNISLTHNITHKDSMIKSTLPFTSRPTQVHIFPAHPTIQ